MIRHRARQGEHLASIAERYARPDSRVLWSAPENAELRAARESPFVLLPGDEIVIPDHDPSPIECSTGTAHRFVARRERIYLSLRIGDAMGAPLRAQECRLEIDGATHTLTTDSDGVISCEIPRAARSGRLTIGGESYDLHIGALDPADAPSGWRARLRNLGYEPGDGDAPEDRRTRLAIEEFQHEHGLRPTGVIDDATRSLLQAAHGQ